MRLLEELTIYVLKTVFVS